MNSWQQAGPPLKGALPASPEPGPERAPPHPPIVPRGGTALVVLSALFGWLPVLGGGRSFWGSA
jgi:hypothetical protein